MQPHEYSVIGLDRTSIGRYLGTAAGLMSAGAAMLVTVCFDLAQRLGYSDGATGLVIFPLNAAIFYFLGHLAFNKWIWRRSIIQSMLGVPDLNGEWSCIGQTKDNNGNTIHEWNGSVTINQTWEKIRVYLNTGQSSSRSKSASLVKEPGRGYVLMYSYQNEPKLGEPELRTHVGYCELQLDEDLCSAEGDYFNNRGRVTFGRMKLIKKDKRNG
jgi:hypothetical protein